MSDKDRLHAFSRASRARWVLRVRHPLQWARQELEWAAAIQRVIDGITVGVLPLDRLVMPEAQDIAFDKVSMSLKLMAECDPQRLAASRRLLRGIQIRAQHRPGYRYATNICVLSADSVLDRSPGAIAGDIVHETMHARFAAAGVISLLASDLLPREEAACSREQIAFARRLPDQIYDRKQIYIAFLESELKKQWWTPEEQSRRYKEWREDRNY